MEVDFSQVDASTCLQYLIFFSAGASTWERRSVPSTTGERWIRPCDLQVRNDRHVAIRRINAVHRFHAAGADQRARARAGPAVRSRAASPTCSASAPTTRTNPRVLLQEAIQFKPSCKQLQPRVEPVLRKSRTYLRWRKIKEVR